MSKMLVFTVIVTISTTTSTSIVIYYDDDNNHTIVKPLVAKNEQESFKIVTAYETIPIN